MSQQEAVAVSAVLCSCYRWLGDQEEYRPEQVEFLVRQRGSLETVCRESAEQVYLVACTAGAVVGMAAVAGNEVTKLYVEPSHHRQGIGAALFASAESVVREGGHDHMFLSTTPSTVPFYERMGMSVTGRRWPSTGPFSDSEVVLMTKTLRRRSEAQYMDEDVRALSHGPWLHRAPRVRPAGHGKQSYVINME